MITQFTIRKNARKEKETHPEYVMSTKVDDQWCDIGGLWVKTDKNGAPYFSGSLSKVSAGRPGYEINVVLPEVKDGEEVAAIEYPTEETNPNDIPF